MNRESFIFYQSFHRALEPLPPESYKNVMTSILEYAISGKEPELTGIEQSFFILIKPQLDKNQERYENGNKGGRPKTKEEPNHNQDITEPKPNDNQTVTKQEPNDNVNVNDNINRADYALMDVSDDPPLEQTELQSVSTADAVVFSEGETNIIKKPLKSPGKTRRSSKLALTQDQMTLYHAAKACFETSEKAKAMIYQDEESTKRELKHLKTFVVRCSNIAPGIEPEFLQNVLEHFKIMCNGVFHGKMSFTPHCLVTPWVWALVIESLPENNVTPEIYESIKRMFT